MARTLSRIVIVVPPVDRWVVDLEDGNGLCRPESRTASPGCKCLQNVLRHCERDLDSRHYACGDDNRVASTLGGAGCAITAKSNVKSSGLDQTDGECEYLTVDLLLGDLDLECDGVFGVSCQVTDWGLSVEDRLAWAPTLTDNRLTWPFTRKSGLLRRQEVAA